MKRTSTVMFAVVLMFAHTHRSPRARATFMHEHPCPSTGATVGACPGYVIDHIIPLACAGPDEPANMQWQTIEEARAKDKWERRVFPYHVKGCDSGENHDTI